VQKIQKEIDKHSKNTDSAKVLTDSISKLNKVIIQYKLNIVKQNPKSFLAFMINIMKEPEVPDAPTLPNGRRDSALPTGITETISGMTWILGRPGPANTCFSCQAS